MTRAQLIDLRNRCFELGDPTELILKFEKLLGADAVSIGRRSSIEYLTSLIDRLLAGAIQNAATVPAVLTKDADKHAEKSKRTEYRFSPLADPSKPGFATANAPVYGVPVQTAPPTRPRPSSTREASPKPVVASVPAPKTGSKPETKTPPRES